jgi:hypothetical protein
MSKDMVFSANAINYSWRQLVLRAGIGDFKLEDGRWTLQGIPMYYQQPETINDSEKKIIVVPCSDTAWKELLERPAGDMDWFSMKKACPPDSHLSLEYSIPVIFWGSSNEREKFVEYCNDGTLIFHVDILAATFFMLSRWEEINSQNIDAHRRFPASASVAYKLGFLDLPVVDLYGLILREWFKVIVPDCEPVSSEFQIKITHDIDWIHRFSSFGQFARMAGSALLKRRDLKEVISHFKSLYVQVTTPSQDDFYRSIYQLAEISESHQLSGHFYFMAANHSPYQQGYDPSSPLIRQCFHDLRKHGHEIGIHPGYDTLNDPEELIVEKKRLEVALDDFVTAGRQHYLRFHVPNTWRHWEQAGLLYDSTMGFADFEGFRCGTCHPYHPFDIEMDQEMKIQEIPLIVMDATLKLYRNLSAQQGKNRMLILASRCRDVGGTFTLLWHNTSLHGEWEQWRVAYQDVLSELSERESS